ncbi:LD-carboxypeptidase [Rhodoferax aquaticus]|uniref:LD-carboxypeptidase n=1 Tax=Rhodoferax aquaticus TaxID=2527691 RepID=A0A515ENZ3_9BURK|nr:LD-carboxypeptidase [Rhodoferax aquaticus]QDL54368.1 LD-carboxypeptidase [Rhodoferax aquaticus]
MKKHIYIYSPSGAVRDKAAFKRGIKRLQQLGHDVEVDADALTSHMRFAGDDATRLQSIHRACASGADVALISRGGYGLTRLLADIKYKDVAKAVDRGTQFVGLSDFTAFQLAVLRKTDRITWAGPALCEGFGVGGPGNVEAPDDIMEDCFNDMLLGQGEGSGWRMNAVPNALLEKPDVLLSKNGQIWGGNLSIVVSLLGTPYFPMVKGGILFLEDVAEHPYRIERMLTQLLHAGVLAQQKAVVLGQFTDYTLTSHDRGFKLQSVIAWLQATLKVPVLTNLPFGHVPTKVLLPVGAKAELAVNGRDAMLVWGHVG